MKTMKRFAARICALFVVLTVSLTAFCLLYTSDAADD